MKEENREIEETPERSREPDHSRARNGNSSSKTRRLKVSFLQVSSVKHLLKPAKARMSGEGGVIRN